MAVSGSRCQEIKLLECFMDFPTELCWSLLVARWSLLVYRTVFMFDDPSQNKIKMRVKHCSKYGFNVGRISKMHGNKVGMKAHERYPVQKKEEKGILHYICCICI